jgi:hypothetical protein
MGSWRGDSLMQAWWAAGSVMLTQGSSACACAGGMQRGASAMAAAADAPIIAFFIWSPNGRRVVATPGLSKIVAIAFQACELLQIAVVCSQAKVSRRKLRWRKPLGPSTRRPDSRLLRSGYPLVQYAN